jgi:hypothetical protein
MEVSGQLHSPAAPYSRESVAGTHCTGGWVGPRASLGTRVRKNLSPAGNRTLAVQSVAHFYTHSGIQARFKMQL